MKPGDFRKGATGEVTKTTEGHWAFVPNGLPPRFDYPAGLVALIGEAERALGELNALGSMIPNAMLLIRPFMAREAVLSSRIEGTVTTLQQLLMYDLDAEDRPDDGGDAREVHNYVYALHEGLRRLDEIPLCLRLIREVHENLMQGVRGQEKAPGQFRSCPVMIGRRGQSYDQARFVPPHPTDLEPLLRDFEKFLNDSAGFPPVVAAALAHYQFEAIHPFMDGNGRVGRLLIGLLFHARGSLTRPLLYLSAYFEAHDAQYRDHLLAVSQRGTWAEWIAFFARGVAEQSRDAIRRARTLLELQTAYRERLQKKATSAVLLRFVDHLFRSPYVTAPGMARHLEITLKAAQNNVQKLIDNQILTNVDPGRKRGRVYRATEILDLLDAPLPAQAEPYPRKRDA